LEPLERGYGITVGNALRRVLLSSLPGAAVTSVRIQGVLHEFSSIPGVVEDTTDIILNLKQLNLKTYTDETKLLRVEREGPGEVLARDIQADSDVDIMNPDLHLATLADGGRLWMEMVVRQGKGYVSAARMKEGDVEIGVIPMDCLFSPIRRVKYSIENTRVGQVTDYDKLSLEVWTNGAITPQEALSSGAAIMRDHLAIFLGLAGTSLPGEEKKVEAEADPKVNKWREMGIEELDLSVRSYNCLKRAGINTVEELVEKSPEDMMKVRNLGKKSLDELKQKMSALGLSLRIFDD
jgi:DNA-directed RNA polymerase subunit alpha